jgi:hypothetical protein
MSSNNFNIKSVIYPTSGNPRYATNLYVAPPCVRLRNFSNSRTHDIAWGKNVDIGSAGQNWGRTITDLAIYDNVNKAIGNVALKLTLFPNVNNIYRWRVQSNSLSGSVDTLYTANVMCNPINPLNISGNLALCNANALPTPTTLDKDSVPEDGNIQPTILRLNYLSLTTKIESKCVGSIAQVKINNFKYNGYPITFASLSELVVKNTPTVTYITSTLYLPINPPSGNTTISFNLRANNACDFSTNINNNLVDIRFGIATPIYSNICLEDKTLVKMSDGSEKEIGQIYASDRVMLADGGVDIVHKNIETQHNRKYRMVHFKKDCLGENIPYMDTFITSGHKIRLLDGNVKKARDLINGNTIKYKNKYIRSVNSLVLSSDDHFYIAHGMACKGHSIAVNANNNFTDNINTLSFIND